MVILDNESTNNISKMTGLRAKRTHKSLCYPVLCGHWGIPSSDGIPNGVADFFFLLLPPPKMAFPEAKRNEGNLALTWYFRKSFL